MEQLEAHAFRFFVPICIMAFVISQCWLRYAVQNECSVRPCPLLLFRLLWVDYASIANTQCDSWLARQTLHDDVRYYDD